MVASSLVSTPAFLALPAATLREIVKVRLLNAPGTDAVCCVCCSQRDGLNMEEGKLLDAVVAWAKAEAKRNPP